MKLKLLIVDDHPLILDSYQYIFKNKEFDQYDIEIVTAIDCESSVHALNECPKQAPFDLAFLDVNLPSYEAAGVLSGEDLALKCKQLFPDIKVVFLTMHNNNFRITNLLKNVNPDGLLIKNDINAEELQKVLENVIKDPPYYSNTVLKTIRKQMSNDFVIDSIDRQLLYYISNGLKTKDLPSKIPLSLGALEKRKKYLKEIFGANAKDDYQLIEQAKAYGFI